MVKYLVDDDKRILEYKNFQIIRVCTHNKCGSLGITLEKFQLRIHLGWYMIIIGEYSKIIFHSEKWFKKNYKKYKDSRRII